MFKLLYSGFDQFDVAFQGALPRDVVAVLEAAKEEAQKQQEPVLVTVGPGRVDMHVAENGKRGGYAFSCNTGPTGEQIWFKKSSNPSLWNILVSVHSKALVCCPLQTTFNRIKRTLADIGCIVGQESINRIDFAMDFLAPPDFELRHEQFVAHRRAKVRPYWSEKADSDENQPSAVLAGRRCESVTIGKMPGRQIIVYDKRRDAIDKGKMYLFDLWRIDPKDQTKRVWRIEIRAGKKHLKDRWRLSTFADIEAAIGDVFKLAMEDVRYLADDQSDSNVSRQDQHTLWLAGSEIAFYAMQEHRAGLTPDQVKTAEREQLATIYASQIRGLAAGLSVVYGMDEADILAELESAIGADLRQALQSADGQFWDSRQRAMKRLHFTTTHP
jgi:hypothetical protein